MKDILMYISYLKKIINSLQKLNNKHKKVRIGWKKLVEVI